MSFESLLHFGTRFHSGGFADGSRRSSIGKAERHSLAQLQLCCSPPHRSVFGQDQGKAALENADIRKPFEHALEIAATIENPHLRARITYDYARALETEGDAAGAALRFRQAYEAGRGAQRGLALSEALA